MSGIFESMGIDSGIVIIVLLILTIIGKSFCKKICTDRPAV